MATSTARTAPPAAPRKYRSRRPALEATPRTLEEFRAQSAALMSETDLQNTVLALAEGLGWLPYHTHDSRRSHKGYPDLTLAHDRQGRFVLVELKSEKGRQSPEQIVWERTVRAIPFVEFYLWRPSHLLSDEIEAVLAGRPTRSTSP